MGCIKCGHGPCEDPRCAEYSAAADPGGGARAPAASVRGVAADCDGAEITEFHIGLVPRTPKYLRGELVGQWRPLPGVGSFWGRWRLLNGDSVRLDTPPRPSRAGAARSDELVR